MLFVPSAYSPEQVKVPMVWPASPVRVKVLVDEPLLTRIWSPAFQVMAPLVGFNAVLLPSLWFCSMLAFNVEVIVVVVSFLQPANNTRAANAIANVTFFMIPLFYQPLPELIPMFVVPPPALVEVPGAESHNMPWHSISMTSALGDS